MTTNNDITHNLYIVILIGLNVTIKTKLYYKNCSIIFSFVLTIKRSKSKFRYMSFS